MEDVIKKIITIEKKAQEVMDSALRENEETIKAYTEKKKVLELQIMSEANNKIEQLRERELTENAESRKALEAQCDLKMSEIERKVQKNQELWVQDLVNKVLKR